MLRADRRAVRSTAVRTKVAFDVGPLIGPRSGVGRAVQHLLGALREQAEPPILHPYVLSFRAPLEPGTARLPFPAALAHRTWTRIDRPRADRWLGRPDVVHGTNYVVPPTHSPRLVTVYDCWFLRHPEDVDPDVAHAGAVLRRAVRQGAVVHTSSEATAEQVRELLDADRVEVIPLGTIPVEPPPPHPPPAVRHLDGRPYVVAIGTIERRKNLPLLVAAFAEAAAGTDLELVLAGAAGNDQPAVLGAIGALAPALRSRVHVLGRIDEPTKSWLLHHARVLAYPSLDEGFGFPVLEAFDAAIPVVASTAGSIPEVAGEAALLVDPRDIAGFAEALLTVHLDDSCRRLLIASGATRSRGYDWATTARSMTHLYDALAMEGHR